MKTVLIISIILNIVLIIPVSLFVFIFFKLKRNGTLNKAIKTHGKNEDLTEIINESEFLEFIKTPKNGSN